MIAGSWVLLRAQFGISFFRQYQARIQGVGPGAGAHPRTVGQVSLKTGTN